MSLDQYSLEDIFKIIGIRNIQPLKDVKFVFFKDFVDDQYTE